MRPEYLRRALTVLTVAVAATTAWGSLRTDWLWRADAAVYDALVPTVAAPPSDDLLLVAIDDLSLSQLGRWPRARRVHAALIDVLTAEAVKTVIFDVAFTEPTSRDDDERLANAIRRNGRVVLPVVLEEGPSGAPVEALPIPPLAAAAAGLGHVDVEADADGVTRTLYLRAGIGRPRWPALPLAGELVATGRSPADTVDSADGEHEQAASLAWVRADRVLVPFSGGSRRHGRASYVDVLKRRFPLERLRGTTVVVGVTAVGLGSSVSTPTSDASSPMAGAELVAGAYDALRTARTLRYLDFDRTTILTVALAAFVPVAVSASSALPVGLVLSSLLPLLVAAGLMHGAALWFTPSAAVLGAAVGCVTQRVLRRRPARLERSRAAEAARVAEVGSIGEAVFTIDTQERIQYLNKIAERWSGMTQERARGKLASVVLPILDVDMRPVRYAQLAGAAHLQGFAVGRDHLPRHVHANVAANRDESGNQQGLVVSLATDQRVTDSVLAAYDALTGLPAHTRLRDHLAQVLGDVRSTGKQGAVLILDVERLRDVNVALGREAGDELLVEAAARLRGATTGRGVAGRIGGGEFAVVYDDVRLDEDICALGNRILAAFANPFTLRGSEVRVSLRIGVSVFPADGEDPDTLLQRADTAMRATTSKEQSVRVYERAMSQTSRDRVRLTRALEVAIEKRTLSLVYQPIVDLVTGALIGVEALARWRDNGHGLVPPSTFVPLAEETGLISALGAWTMDEACRQMRAWDGEGLPPLWVSVNVSPRQFLQPAFEKSVRRAIAMAGLPPTRLMLEVTESAMQDVDHAIDILARLKAAGATVALDDFGVGYSSLSHLSQLPVDVVKIDRSFVAGIDVDGPDRTICLAVLSLGESLQRRVVAEGVERGSQMEFLRSKGCREVQGFFVGRPVGPEQIPALLRRGPILAQSPQRALPFH
jgi:diguanylate cyclase (GGDEF)-like protein